MKLRIALVTLVLLGVCSTVSMQPSRRDLAAKMAFGGGSLPPPCYPPFGGNTQASPCLFGK
jgi:hypothetical protein